MIIKYESAKIFFLKTLSISNGPVNEALKYRDELGNYTGKDGRGSRVPVNKTNLESKQKIIDHINSFPRLESHYCRKKSKRQYLESKLTIAKMYELYKEQLTTLNEEPCSFYVYKTIFGSKFNLSFFTPKKDLCITCTRYDSAGRPEHLKEEYDSHIARKNEAQQAKESDKQRSIIDDNYLVVTADMQSTLHIPVSGVGILYYTRKLNVQNYTIHTYKPPHEAFCITWNEINECPTKSTFITRKRRKLEEQKDGQGTEELMQVLKNYKMPPAYSSPLPISEGKKKDVNNLCAKGIIPQELHLWYQSLPTSKDVVDRILEPDVTEEGEEEVVD
ncbi:unnamed protein product [Parnassius apollo]|uniref:(apollo) hypothetical protein n=1 Tax=Parnassius apollo TaxID=110799 RepID=A0A8S3XGC0_PARAO|nr:unnamed protein product [Parnassius apollo]